jgi:glutaredoxin-like protein
MPIIQERDRIEIQKRLEAMEKPVKIVYFAQEFECYFCRETRELMEEFAALSDQISLEVYDFVKDKDVADKYNVDKIPAAVLEGDQDYGIRFFGIPAGYEFSSLLEDVLMVSRGDSGLEESSRQKLAQLSKPLHLQVFVTPT